MIVESQPDLAVVAEAGDGDEAVRVVRAERPDVVLMDVRMPRMDGIEATRQISAATRVVILTTYELDEYVFDALAAGASAFLLKASPPEELVRAIRIVAAGDALLAPSVTRRLIEEFGRRPELAARSAGRLEGATDREGEGLKEVARGHTNAEIATRLHVA